MNRMGVFVALLVMMAVAGCGGSGGGTGVMGAKFKAKIIVKSDGSKCISRTVPRHIDFEKGEFGGFTWKIQDKSSCLPAGVNLELRFTSGNPTTCNPPTTTDGNKTTIDCNLGTFADNTVYKYDVYLVGTGHPTGGTKIEDPDIEIVVF